MSDQVSDGVFENVIVQPKEEPKEPEESTEEQETEAQDKQSPEGEETGGEEEAEEAQEEPGDGSGEDDAGDKGDPEPYDIQETDVLQINGEKYPAAELLKALKDKATWTKENTEKAQKLADEKKALKEATILARSQKAIADALSEDKELFEKVEKHLSDAGKNDVLERVKKAMEGDLEKAYNPWEEEIGDLQKKIENYEVREKYSEARSKFAKDYGLSEADVSKVEDAILQHYEDTGENIALGHMYLLMKDKGQIGNDQTQKTQSTGKRKPNLPPKVKRKPTGAPSPKEKKRPSTAGEYDVPDAAFDKVLSGD